jgi:DNA-binding GntR family transcriptional regulator
MSAPEATSGRLYQKVAATLEREITEGRYQPGQRLASERDLAEALGVSRPTVRRAGAELQELEQTRERLAAKREEIEKRALTSNT